MPAFFSSLDAVLCCAVLQGYERARFNQPLAGMAWPKALKQLSAGQAFDEPLEGADWPDTLEVWYDMVWSGRGCHGM